MPAAYYLRQESFTRADSILFTDETGAVRFSAKGLLRLRDGCAVLSDETGGEIARISRGGSFLAPRFGIELKEESAVLSRRFSPFKQKYRLEPQGWSVCGDLFSRSFSVSGGEELADIVLGGKPRVRILREGGEALILSIALILLSQARESRRAAV